MISPEDFMALSPEERAKIDPIEGYAGAFDYLAKYIERAGKEKDNVSLMRAAALLLETSRQFASYVTSKVLKNAAETGLIDPAEIGLTPETTEKTQEVEDLVIPGMPKIIGKA